MGGSCSLRRIPERHHQILVVTANGWMDELTFCQHARRTLRGTRFNFERYLILLPNLNSHWRSEVCQL